MLFRMITMSGIGFLEKIQYIKLNGTLTNTPTSVTFSRSQYADRASNIEVWYDQFARDYATRPTVLSGLNSMSHFSGNLSAKENVTRKSGRLEKSFLVAPYITRQIRIIERLQCDPNRSNGARTFAYLAEMAKPLPYKSCSENQSGFRVLLSRFGQKKILRAEGEILRSFMLVSDPSDFSQLTQNTGVTFFSEVSRNGMIFSMITMLHDSPMRF